MVSWQLGCSEEGLFEHQWAQAGRLMLLAGRQGHRLAYSQESMCRQLFFQILNTQALQHYCTAPCPPSSAERCPVNQGTNWESIGWNENGSRFPKKKFSYNQVSSLPSQPAKALWSCLPPVDIRANSQHLSCPLGVKPGSRVASSLVVPGSTYPPSEPSNPLPQHCYFGPAK